jgi:hypothetical protein
MKTRIVTLFTLLAVVSGISGAEADAGEKTGWDTAKGAYTAHGDSKLTTKTRQTEWTGQGIVDAAQKALTNPTPDSLSDWNKIREELERVGSSDDLAALGKDGAENARVVVSGKALVAAWKKENTRLGAEKEEEKPADVVKEDDGGASEK